MDTPKGNTIVKKYISTLLFEPYLDLFQSLYDFFAEIRNYSIFFWLSLPVHSESLKRIDYPKQLSGPPSFFLMSLLLLKELIIIFLFETEQGINKEFRKQALFKNEQFTWFLSFTLYCGWKSVSAKGSAQQNNNHYANLSMQYTAIFHGCKTVHFQMKNCDISLILLKT